MNIADLLLILLLASAFLGSCYFLRAFFLAWKTADRDRSLALPLDLRWSDFLLYLAGFILCYWKAHDWVILYSPAAITGIFILRGIAPFSFWNLDWEDLPGYLKTGLKTYVTIFVPFGLLTAACTWVFTELGFKDINQPAVEMFMRSRGFWPICTFLLFACVAAPLWEEITFRGFLYPFLKAKAGRTTALVASSLLFAAMHQHLPSFVPLAFLGALLALLYERTGSLGNNILLHSFFNLSTCLVLLLLKYGSNPDLWKSV